MLKTVYPVVVIGCGASGIACLTKLADAGVNAIGLEASDRIGGRICTVDFAENVVDLGAAWCHGEIGNLVYELANPLHLLDRPPLGHNDLDWFILSDGSLMPPGNARAILGQIGKKMHNTGSNSIKGAAKLAVGYGVNASNMRLTNLKISVPEHFLEWYERENHLGGQEDPRTGKSLKGLQEGNTCEGEFWLNWKGRGYKTILDVLMEKHPSQDPSPEKSFDIQYNKEVTNIRWDMTDVDVEGAKPMAVVTCADGSEIKAERVVVTVSLGVLKERHSTMFIPPLPADKITAIENLQFCILDKIYIEFESPWWPKDMTNFKILWREEDKTKFDETETWITGIYGLRIVEHQPNVLLAWIYGTHAREMDKFLDIFKLNFKVTPVKEIIRSQWASNKLIRGAYSYRAVSTEEARTSAKQLYEPLNDVVFFAGEAASERWYNSVHGAIDAGFRAARDVITAIGTS